MTMCVPLLSVVIATKDREKYCIAAIQSILAFNSHEVQIVISDNSKSHLIEEYLNSSPSEQVVYQYDPTPMSFIENFNRAMSLASGEYVCLIGDDDTVLPQIVDAVRWAKANDVDSIASTNYIHYYWPGARKDFPDGLLLAPSNHLSFSYTNVRNELQCLLRNGIVNYVFFDLPKTYHGIVRRTLLEEVRSRTSQYYGGLSPDIYSAITLSCIARNHVSVSVPLTIAGVCAKSGTAENLTGRHAGDLENMPHLKNRGEYIWDLNVPGFYSVSTVWAESGLKALSEMGETDLYNYFNVYPLLVQSFYMNRNEIMPLMLKKAKEMRIRKGIGFVPFWIMIGYYSFDLLIDKTKRVLKAAFGKSTKQFEGVSNIHDALLKIKQIEPYNTSGFVSESVNIKAQQ